MNLNINDQWKKFRSENYNYDFNIMDGTFLRWGKTVEDDPEMSPFGPEILDIEVSTKCSFLCNFCYKSNLPNGYHMNSETFKIILDKFPKYNGIHFLTQVAFGIGDIDASDDLWKMMEYCRSQDVIPNVTINGSRLTEKIIDNLVSLCGAVAVSRYTNKDICYDAVKQLTDRGMKQINIHQMISEETFDQTMETLNDIIHDPRLERMNAIVFLSLKQKGRGVGHNKLSMHKFKKIVQYCLRHNIRFGFDSCGANKVSEVFREMNILDRYEQYIEPCESGAFSSYINVEGVFYPCSFSNNCTVGIDILQVEDFLTDVWHDNNTIMERSKIQMNGRSCPYFEV